MAVNKDDLHYQFLLEEYKALRQEIDLTMSQMRQVIYLNVVGCGAVWYFILSADDKKVIHWSLYWLPLVVSIACGFYMFLLRRDVKRMGEYIKKVEGVYLLENPRLGWEHFLSTKTGGFFLHTRQFENLYWIVLMTLNLLGALIKIR